MVSNIRRTLSWSRGVIFLIHLLLASNNIVRCFAQENSRLPQAVLLEAVRADDPIAIEKAIVELGADIDLQGGGGQTPLVLAVLSGKLQAVETLLKLGANVDIPEKDGYTVMHAAGFQGRAEILKILAAHQDGAIDFMHLHSDGYYPMHRACWGRERRHTETVQTFLELGVPPDLPAINGKDCLTMAKNPDTRSLVETALKKKSSEL